MITVCDGRVAVPWPGGKLGVVQCGKKAPVTSETVYCKACEKRIEREAIQAAKDTETAAARIVKDGKFNLETEDGRAAAQQAAELRFQGLMKRTPKERFDYLISKGWTRIDRTQDRGHITIIWRASMETTNRLYSRPRHPLTTNQTHALNHQCWLDVIDEPAQFYCGWCNAPKPNEGGMCGSCFRFPTDRVWSVVHHGTAVSPER
jgi:hypothetical protein